MTVINPTPPKFNNNLPRIPGWVPPLDTGQPTAGDINDLSDIPRENFAARNTIIPIPYGRDRFFVRPFVVSVCQQTGCLIIAFGLGEGEINGYEEIIVDSNSVITAGTGYIGVLNRGFETGDKFGWETAGSGSVVSGGYTGTYAMRVPGGSGGPNQFSDRLPAPPEGFNLKISVWTRRNGSPTTGASVGVRYATSSGGALSGRTSVSPASDHTDPNWQLLETTWTVPAGAVEYVIDLGECSSLVGDWDFDDVETYLVDDNGDSTDAMEFCLYTGASGQGMDSLLHNVLTGYEDTCDGLAYIVGRFPPGTTSGFPRVEVIYQGRKVYDPRQDSTSPAYDSGYGVGSHRINDPTTWEYSTNPALCFMDMVTNFSRWTVEHTGIADLANHNEVIISGSIKRRELGLTLTKPATLENWVKVFREYMGGFVAWEDGQIRVIPNRADVEAQGAFTFDGSTSTYARGTATTDFNLADGSAMTIEAWVKGPTQSSGFARVFDMLLTTDHVRCQFKSDGAYRIAITDGATPVGVDSTSAIYDDDQWHHVAYVIDRGAAKDLYIVVDGAVASSVADLTSMTGTITVSTGNLTVGADDVGGNRLIGLIDEVRVWSEARTTQEIQDNMYSEIADPTTEANLIGYWKANETGGSTASDSSSTSLDLTLTGAAAFTFGNPQVIPDGVTMHITADDILKDSLRIRRRSLRSVPNSVAVDYVDASGPRWLRERAQADSARLVAGDEARRLSRVSLPGIHNATQAQRVATERLNWYLTDLEATVTLFDEGWQLQNGSIVAMTHPIGLDGKLFRVTRLNGISGRWTVDLVEYDPAVYSDEVVTDPTIPDTFLGNPLNPPLPTGLVLDEELFRYRSGLTGSRVRITYDKTGYSFFSQYLVEGYVGGVKVWETSTQSTNVVTPPVEELVEATGAPVDYEVRVYTQSPFATSDFSTGTITVEGKFLIPADVTEFGGQVISAGTAELTWGAVDDIDIWRYEIRQGTTSDTWATATLVDQLDNLRVTVSNLAVGTHRFFVKAVDSVKQYSTNAATFDIQITNPPAVTVLTGFEVASEVRLRWNAPGSGFVDRYRVAYDTIPATNEITLDIVDTLTFSTKDVAEGTWRFLVYSRDALGNETATPATIDIEVTSDADAFLADTYDFVQATDQHANGTLSNFVEYVLRTDSRKFYVTNMGDVFSSSPSDFNTYSAEALANYHSSGTSFWLSETKDFGIPLTGSWNLTHDVTALNGSYEIQLELSTDDVTYDTYGLAAKGEFRYARVRVTALSTSTAFVKSPIMSLKINVVPIEENGEDVASPTAPKTINLAREYTAVKEVNVQPKYATGADSTMGVVDNIVVGANTAIKGDGTNYLDGGDIAAFDFGATQDFSIELWTRPDLTQTSGSKVIVSKFAIGTGGWECLYDATSGKPTMYLDDGTNTANLTPTSTINDGNYHHIAWTVDRTGDQVRLYVDGTEDASSPFSIAAVTGTLDAGTGAFRVFTFAGGTSQYSGEVDDLRIWTDVRTAQEITDNKDGELDMTITHTGLAGYWRVNGDVSSAVPTGAGAVTDATVNGYDLTASGVGLTYTDPGSQGNPITKINSFDAYLFDIFGQQTNDAFQWNWKGV